METDEERELWGLEQAESEVERGAEAKGKEWWPARMQVCKWGDRRSKGFQDGWLAWKREARTTLSRSQGHVGIGMNWIMTRLLIRKIGGIFCLAGV